MAAGLAAGCGKSDAGDGNDKKAEASEWDASMDVTIVSREDGSGTRGAFIELFGIEDEIDGGESGYDYAGGPDYQYSTSVMMTTVAEMTMRSDMYPLARLMMA